MNSNIISLMEKLGWTVSLDKSLHHVFSKGEFDIRYYVAGDLRIPHAPGGWYLARTIVIEGEHVRFPFRLKVAKRRTYDSIHQLLCEIVAYQKDPKPTISLSHLIKGLTQKKLDRLLKEEQWTNLKPSETQNS